MTQNILKLWRKILGMLKLLAQSAPCFSNVIVRRVDAEKKAKLTKNEVKGKVAANFSSWDERFFNKEYARIG